MIVDRISGDAPPDYFIGPTWCLDKPAVKAAVLAEFERRGTLAGMAMALLTETILLIRRLTTSDKYTNIHVSGTRLPVDRA